MSSDKLNRLWLLSTGILILIIIVSSTVVWIRRDSGEEIIQVMSSDTSNIPEYISVEGAVANPGSFPFRQDDSINDLINAAGGFTQNADSSNITIMVLQKEAPSTSQKVNINRADVWLLEALPDIGEVRAQAIVDYRTNNGTFKNIEEMMEVPGLSESTFNKLKAFVTVSE